MSTYIREKFSDIMPESRMDTIAMIDSFLDSYGQYDHHSMLDEVESQMNFVETVTTVDQVHTVYLVVLRNELANFGVDYTGINIKNAFELLETLLHLEGLPYSDEVEECDTHLDILIYWYGLMYPNRDTDWFYEDIGRLNWIQFETYVQVLKETAEASERYEALDPVYKNRLASYAYYESSIAQRHAQTHLQSFVPYAELDIPVDELNLLPVQRHAIEYVGFLLLSTEPTDSFEGLMRHYVQSKAWTVERTMTFITTALKLIQELGHVSSDDLS